jgi:hypothetical protein
MEHEEDDVGKLDLQKYARLGYKMTHLTKTSTCLSRVQGDLIVNNITIRLEKTEKAKP